MSMNPGRHGRGSQFNKFSEMVADDLRGRMARGEVRPGDHLPCETELMDIYGVARPTMREALRILESESLIILRRGSHLGPLVQEPETRVLARQTGLRLQMQGTPLGDLVEARAVMEPAAVALAARRRTGSDLRAMRDCLAIVAVARDIRDFHRRSTEFRNLVVRSSHNRALILMAELVSSLLWQHYEPALGRIPESVGHGFAEPALGHYRRLISLIEDRDAHGAVAFWEAHAVGVDIDFRVTASTADPEMVKIYS